MKTKTVIIEAPEVLLIYLNNRGDDEVSRKTDVVHEEMIAIYVQGKSPVEYQLFAGIHRTGSHNSHYQCILKMANQKFVEISDDDPIRASKRIGQSSLFFYLRLDKVDFMSVS